MSNQFKGRKSRGCPRKALDLNYLLLSVNFLSVEIKNHLVGFYITNENVF